MNIAEINFYLKDQFGDNPTLFAVPTIDGEPIKHDEEESDDQDKKYENLKQYVAITMNGINNIVLEMDTSNHIAQSPDLGCKLIISERECYDEDEDDQLLAAGLTQFKISIDAEEQQNIIGGSDALTYILAKSVYQSLTKGDDSETGYE